MFDFSGLNGPQKEAVVSTEGPLLVIAGPGTGKTFTLVKRIAYLVTEKNTPPEKIMVVTFTEKAARELLTRISNEFARLGLSLNVNDMYIGTFHSVCLRLIKEFSDMSETRVAGRLMDAFEQTYLVCRNIDRFRNIKGFVKQFGNTDVWKQSQEICRYSDQLMEEMADIDAMAKDEDEDMRFLAALVRRYKELLRQNDVMDFSMIQTETYRMLAEDPEILSALREKISYVMVDEYQDTNCIQERLALLIAQGKNNICVVGDDDQGMYRFRGATIRNILEFPDNVQFMGKCRRIYLETNYRSEPDIIDFYNNWMKGAYGVDLFNWDKFRYDKTIRSGRDNATADNSVFICGGDSLPDEKESVLLTLGKLKENGAITDYNQAAFLFRSVKSDEARELAEHLEQNGIPVYSPRSDMFFERDEIKLITSCFILAFKSYRESMKSGSFIFPIPKKLVDYYSECVEAAMQKCRENKPLQAYIGELRKTIANASADTGMTLLDVFYRLLSFAPFNEMFGADIRGNINETRAVRNLSEFSRLIARFSALHNVHTVTNNNKHSAPEELFNQFIKYLYIDGIGEYEDDSEYAPSGCVSFMTIHQSKGLEFPVVFVGSLNSVPRQKSDSLMYGAELHYFQRGSFEPVGNIKYFDFWRLYYTAFSRAQNLLFLLNGSELNKYFEPFVKALPKAEALDISNRSIANVKPIEYKRVYSFTSHIAIYDDCPKQYLYYKEYSFAQNAMFQTSVGSLVHTTLEDINDRAIAGSVSAVNEKTIGEWFEINYRKMQEDTGYSLTTEQKENALQQVLCYYKRRRNELCNAWKAEEEINLVREKYILQGVVDLIEQDGENVEIIDYKTGPKPDFVNFPEKVSHYRKQLLIYAFLIEQRYKRRVSRMRLYYTSALDGDPLITFERKQEDIDAVIAELDETVKNIEEKNFVGSSRKSYVCKNCDMRFLCGKENY